MTNINRKKPPKNVHSYIPENVKAFLDEYLPKTYTRETLEILKEEGIDSASGVVRNVRSGISKNHKILNALVKLAEKYKHFHDEAITIVDNKT